jgi:RHS repeat-associated protein
VKPHLASPLIILLALALIGACSDKTRRAPRIAHRAAPAAETSALVPADPFGTIDGTFSVDPNGAATYEIPLEIPPGTQGLAPQLALTYNSQRDNGMIGMGWALNGIENIARCNATQVSNGYTAPVTYTYRDRFCMAGMPLIAISGEYGYDGTEYRTTRDTWTRVISHGTCGQGPCWFSAQNKDGAELRFGFTTGASGSRILASGRTDGAVRVWSQDRHTDLNGNWVALSYSNNAVLGEYYPVRIDYSGNDTTGLAPQRAVTFEYELRSDRITGYTGGSPFQILSRLTAIKTWVGTTLVKHITIGYATGTTTGRSQVASIQECTGDSPSAATCLPATTFTLSNPANGFSAGSTINTAQSTSSQLGLLTMDVNGDGKTDFVDAWQGSGKLHLTTYLSAGRNLGAGSSQSTSTDAGKLGVLGMDVNGDRRGDVVMPVDLGGSLSLYAYLSTGTSFGGALQSMTGRSPKALSYLPMDVNGDGLEDVVQVLDRGGKVGFVVFPSTGTGSFGPAVESSSSFSTDNTGFFPLDANGDGQIDVVQIQKSGTVQFITYLSDGRAFDGGTETSTGRSPSQYEIDAGDVNGDSLGDLLLLDTSGSSVEVVPYLSTGTTFRNVRSTTLQGGSNNLGIASATLNGDDRADLLQRIDKGGKVSFLPLYGNGETFTAGTAFDSSLGKESLGQKLLDLDGDGKQDVLEPRDSGGKLALSLVLNTVGQPDLLTRVVNSLGGEAVVTHLPMTDGSIYTKGTTATYPVVDIQTSMPLVAAYTNKDGRGGNYTFSYRYDQGRVGYGGRGWLSFRAVKMVQDSNDRFSEVIYSQDYPGNGLVIKNGTYNQNGVALGTTDLTYADVSSAALQARGIHQWVRTSESYSAYADNHGGARLYTLKKAYAYDSYGNVSMISDLGQPGIATDDRFTCFRYQNDLTRWRLGYVVQELLAKTPQRCDAFLASSNPSWDPATDVSWQKRAYDARMNQIESSVWDDSNNVWVSANSTFDDYGNQLTATDPTGNTTSFEYDATYHTFLARVTSPPNQQGTRLVDSFEWEPYFGNQVRNVDPNGNVFEWAVDTLGRVVDEYGPAPDGPPTDPVRLRHSAFGKDATGFFTRVSSRPSWSSADDPSTWFWEMTYSDGLLREWRSVTRGATDDTATVNEIRFNAEGQISHTSLPFFANENPSFIVTTYDVYNRPTTVTQPDGTVQKLDYSQLGSLKVYTTDAFGTTDARTEIDQFDAYGQLISQTLPNGEVYRYRYNLMGELEQIDTLPDRRQVVFTYDSLGRLRQTTTNDTGTTRYHWNALNQMTGSTDADGNALVYGYDALGRIVTTTGTTGAGSHTVRLTYDGATSNGKGNVTRAELSRAPLGSYSYDIGYDPYKQTRTVQVALAGGSYAYGLDWNPLGQLAAETYPDGGRLSVSYHADGNPHTFDLSSANGPAQNYLTYDGYDANGVPLRTTYKNGVETTRAFYPNDVATGKVKSIIAKRGTSTLFGNEYTWNRLDFVTKVADLTAARGDELYMYDPAKLGFLTTAQGPYGNESYGYDRVGNRTAHNGVPYTYSTNSDRLASYGPDTSLSWNGNGTLESLTNPSGTFHFTYDASGRVVGVAKDGVGQPGVLAYDFSGNRVFYQPIGSNTKVYGISADYEIADYGDGKVLATKYIEGEYGRAVAITTPTTAPGRAAASSSALSSHRHAMAARLFQGGAGLDAAFLSTWHGTLAVLTAPAVTEALVLGLVLLLLGGCAITSALLALRRGLATPTLFTRQRPVFAASVPLVATCFLLFCTVPAEAALTPGANGVGNPTEGTLFFTQDLVQSTVLVTDDNGQATASVGYLPFGGLDPAASQGVDNFRPKFTDKTLDSDTGLYFFGERHYDPAVGRFITPDPAAQYLNPYVLGADNPISQIDPNGEFAFLAVIIIGAVIGAYMGAAAVNHDYNPANWDWKSGKTYAGLFGGAVIGAVGGVIVEVAATAGVAAGIAGAVLVGAGENAAFTAMGGGSAKDILISAAEGAAFGFLFGGAGAALGRLFRGAGSAASEAGGLGRAGRAARAGAELVENSSEAAESAVARGLRSSCSSFLPGETVLGADGSTRPIEALAVGDRVLGYVQTEDASGSFQVAATLSGETSAITKVVTASGAEIEATPNHPFRVAGMGWIPAGELNADLALVDPQGKPVPLRSVQNLDLPAPRAVYNVSVDSAESYYVSGDHVLVKNVHGACLLAKGKRRPGWRSAVKDRVFGRQSISSGVGKGQIKSAVSKARYARSHKVTVGTKGRKVTIWQLDHAKAPYRDLLWAAGKSKKVITWKMMIDISNYAPNLRYLTMSENVSHAFEPTQAAGRKAAIKVLKALGYW